MNRKYLLRGMGIGLILGAGISYAAFVTIPGNANKNDENAVAVETTEAEVTTEEVTEATNLQNELYGEERLLTVMKGATDKTPREVLDLVRNDINEFVDEAPQFDDITMLEMVFKGR